MLKDLLDRVCDFSADTITRNKGHLTKNQARLNPEWQKRTVYTPPYLVVGYLSCEHK